MPNDTFSFDTVKDFDKHIDVSIPNYSFVAKQVAQFAEYFAEENTYVYDLGCSTGKWLMSLRPKNKVKYVGIDISKNLLPSREIISSYEQKNPNVDINFIDSDLTKFDFPTAQKPDARKTSVVVSLFTLQFLPREERKIIISKIRDSLLPGGIFVSCEKVLSSHSKFQDITNSIYYEFKNQSFSGDEILAKERDLRTIMRLQTVEESIDDMRLIGEPEMFWRAYNFVGLIVRKEK